ncbi:ribulose-phosphate 3-epimerase [Flavobacteriaceae bacterium]|jgi:ribulose-phosphate 3-epimerase|nr:ribulose-phosphate 3-epimerase [Flavobacteriaceae bacterium]MDA9240924.1 ribulose-phosphate 3-epimerase [Flavobacteriaceae bacterium]MDA9323983.1 ribulose-phosphate 3-epimerase [Flavobacteriaceae bacterium]MDA9622696.1 ribulose-phosphate 3-epimerase [Flavobacteriaceae bacterium]MDB4092730.1 ribulose-phosphate 3-epimerase [Flavobacteriaceae bacterium]|tara:strand:+ start:1692 stop:2345 length:654 start_codon:yes stop_codon:yes gene_type:complete
MNIIAPSMLACDFGNLYSEIQMVNKSEANWFHIDVMDGVFVPNISFGTPIMKVLKKNAKKTLDVHLMIVNPDNYLESFAELGADILTVHYEACTHLHRTVQRVKDLKMKAGVAINPHTPISSLKSIIKELDLVCIMSVNPGFGGQSFIEGTYAKVEELKSLIEEQNSKAIIEIDGGVNSENAKKLIDCGANALVAGSFVFKSKNPAETISDLSSLIN